MSGVGRREAVRAFLVSRALVWGAGAGAALILGPGRPLAPPVALGHVANVLAAPAARWDATWYLAIARDG